MLRKKDRLYALRRKKLWDTFGFFVESVNVLSKNRSMDPGKLYARDKAIFKRARRKSMRLASKRALDGDVNGMES